MGWPVTDRFRTAVRSTHEMITEVDVLENGAVIRKGLPMVSGSVSLSEGSKIRRSLDLGIPRKDTADGADLSPKDLDDLLSPIGRELAVRSGVRTSEGAEELAPVGIFGISTVSDGGLLDGVTLRGSDRVQTVMFDRFTSPRMVGRSQPCTSTISTFLTEVNPDWEVYNLSSRDSRPSSNTFDRDRWDAIASLATVIGADVAPDPAGRWIIRDSPVVPSLDDIDRAIAAGTRHVIEARPGDGGALIDVGSSFSSEGVYNALVVIATPEAGLPPIVATAYLTEGPLRWGGPAGHRPSFYASSFIRSRAQALSAAQSMLPQRAAFSRQLSPVLLPDPSIDVGDWVLIVEPDGTRTPSVVREATIPLTPDQMPVTVRVPGQVSVEEGMPE